MAENSPDILGRLDNRADYLASLSEVLGDRPDQYRWAIIKLWRLNAAGVPEVEVGDPLAMYVDFLFQDTSKIDRERVQVSPSSVDGGKAWFFDREIRQYVFQGFVYDIPEGSNSISPDELTTRGYARFMRLYEQAFRLSQAARKRLLVELDTDQFHLWGAMTNRTGAHAADVPTTFVITFGFLVEALQTKAILAEDDYLRISKESAIKAGLAAPSPQELLFTPIPVNGPVLTVSGIEQSLLDATVAGDPGNDRVVVKPSR